MKKKLLALILLAFISSCSNEVIQGYDKLTPGEQEVLRNRSTAQCMADSTPDFDQFKSASDEQFNAGSGTEFYRNKNWKVEVKQGTVISSTKLLHVWKVSTNAVYFIITNIDGAGTITDYDFLKIDSTMNDAMIADLLTKKCAKTLVVSESSSSATVVYEKTAATVNNGTQKEKTDFSYAFAELAYFGVYHYAKTVTPYDSAGTAGTVANYSASITIQTDTVPLAAYTDYPTPEFCVVKNVAGNYTFPYEFECTSNPAGGPASWPSPGSEL